uniref:Uncharacterized protein n=1 Tax=Anguilla anguilla TaxID=7936 RepID=A0A0E9SPG9_ANGAN
MDSVINSHFLPEWSVQPGNYPHSTITQYHKMEMHDGLNNIN